MTEWGVLTRVLVIALVISVVLIVGGARLVLAQYSYTIYFEGVYPSGTGSLGYQLISVNVQVTCNGQHTTYTSVNNVSISCSTSPIYVYVNGLPNGWAPDVWDSTVKAWSYEYNYTISNSGTYYLVTATELVRLASPPVSQLPYEATVVELTNGALVTSLPTLYLVTNSTGVYTPLFGGSGICLLYTSPSPRDS